MCFIVSTTAQGRRPPAFAFGLLEATPFNDKVGCCFFFSFFFFPSTNTDYALEGAACDTKGNTLGIMGVWGACSRRENVLAELDRGRGRGCCYQ